MTRLDVTAEPAAVESAAECDGPRTVLMEARQVPLGGLRAMDVRRSLPQRDLPLIGAWCFLDRFGPQETVMRVDPHPHIGLQTVTWPFVGEVRHRDTLDNDVLISRGQLNLMTAGNGIAHSEYSTGDGPIPLDALQLWVALPESRRHGVPAFEQHTALPTVDFAGGGTATVVLGEFAGVASPASAYTPIVGAELNLPAGEAVLLPLRPEWEHGVVGVFGDVTVAGTRVAPDQLLYLGIHRDGVLVEAETDATIFLLGGEPFEDDIVMWWNFVGRTHEEVVEAREAWEARDARFGDVPGHDTRIPAPEMPHVRLARRRRRI
ncbi:MAG TPA: pirin family protein [Microbacterium sp.]|uniref:pirin family protein n=1 Tax=Microbacterium sp. TaxID=51671 RepID=UPI002B471F7E|nr:pirin family protein [Microbacterium sp.]HKT55615.1 pirin family protein [Microbacterium sp.]